MEATASEGTDRSGIPANSKSYSSHHGWLEFPRHSNSRRVRPQPCRGHRVLGASRLPTITFDLRLVAAVLEHAAKSPAAGSLHSARVADGRRRARRGMEETEETDRPDGRRLLTPPHHVSPYLLSDPDDISGAAPKEWQQEWHQEWRRELGPEAWRYLRRPWYELCAALDFKHAGCREDSSSAARPMSNCILFSLALLNWGSQRALARCDAPRS